MTDTLGLLGQQRFYRLLQLGLQLFVGPTGGLAREARVSASHEPVPSDEKSGGPGIEIHGLRELFGELAGLAGEEDRVLQPILFDESAQADRIFELLAVFEGQGDDLEAASAVGLVQLLQERRLVVAIGAPTAHDVQE